MSNPFTASTTPEELDQQSDFARSNPSIGQAACDLRAAAADKAREFVQAASDKASSLKDRAMESAQNLRSAAAEKAQTFKDAAGDQWHGTCEKAKDLQVSAEDYIRQNPTKCILSALGIGLLIGLVVRR